MKYVKRIVCIVLSALLVFNSLTKELTAKTAHIAAGIAIIPIVFVHIFLADSFSHKAKNLFSKKLRLNRKAADQSV